MRLVYWALIIYFVYLVWKFISGPKKKQAARGQDKRQPQMMVKDETCNTYLPVEEAIKETCQGKDYYFCSRDCRQKFLDKKKAESLSRPSDS
jgi:YHS domain-containing protein